jgi:hypothetical protein
MRKDLIYGSDSVKGSVSGKSRENLSVLTGM